MAGFEILTVSQLHRYVKSLLDGQPALSDIMVQGELSNISPNTSSGHVYFSIRDQGGLIRCVMFRRYAENLRTLPENGAMVLVRGKVTLYERDGTFQIIAYDMQILGVGGGQVLVETLKRKLQEEGLFDPVHKRPLPPFPRTVGIITSRDGAALHDITETFATHNPAVRLILYPATVQGPQAAATIVAALDQLEAEDLCDCVIITRGGGSSEDLSAFEDEALARRAFACQIPIISAVGHEVDYSILDFVADVRAATPTAACRAASPSRDEVLSLLAGMEAALTKQLAGLLDTREKTLTQLDLRLEACSPLKIMEINRQKNEYLLELLITNQQRLLQNLEGRRQQLTKSLSHLNPAALMSRGYTITKHNDHIITTGQGLAPGEEIETLFADGRLTSTVVAYREVTADE